VLGFLKNFWEFFRAVMDYTEFVKKFSKEKLKPVYLSYGSEKFLRAEVLQIVRKRLDNQSIFYKEYNATEDFSIASLMNDLCSDALFDDLNFIVIRSAHSSFTALLEPLTAYLKSPNPNSILFLDADKADNRSKFSQMVKKYGGVINCKAFYDRPKPWLNLTPW